MLGKNVTDESHDALLADEDFATYSMRSAFFVRRLREVRLWAVIDDVMRLPRVREGFSWRERAKWGIEAEAWHRITNEEQIDPLLYFCHPKVISEQPRLLLYYRTLSLVPQKGLIKLVGGNIAKIEEGRAETIPADWCRKVTLTINSLLSALTHAAAEMKQSYLAGLQFAAIGATIQGSWNNKVGKDGEVQVKTILANHLRKEISQVVWKNQTSWEYDKEKHEFLIDSIEDVRIIRLKDGYHLFFSSEPDVSLRDPDDVPVLAIEVKAGTDKPGALERFGAGIKSFERDRDLNPRVKTVYVVRAMTQELRRRIQQGNPFDHTFGLAELVTDEKTQKTFANLIIRTMLKSR